MTLELGGVQEPQHERHGDLSHGQEERSHNRNRHHFVEVYEQVRAELSEAL